MSKMVQFIYPNKLDILTKAWTENKTNKMQQKCGTKFKMYYTILREL